MQDPSTSSLSVSHPPRASSLQAQVVAFRSQAQPTGVDLSYRLYGLGVPISASERALLVDEGRYELPTAGKGFSTAIAVLN